MLRRWAAIVTGCAGVLAVLWAAEGSVLRGRYVAAREALAERVGTLGREELAPPAVDAADNAAHWIRRAIEEAGLAVEGEEPERGSLDAPHLETLVELDRLPLAEWDGDRRSEAERSLAALGLDRDDWLRIAGAPGSDFGIRYADGLEGASASMPGWLAVLGLSRAMSVDARLGLATGDGQRFLAAARALAATTRALCREPTLVTHAVGHAVEWSWSRALAGYLATGGWRRDELSTLRTEALATDCGSAIEEALHGESLLVLEGLREASTDEGVPRRWELWLATRTLEAWVGMLDALPLSYAELRGRYESGTLGAGGAARGLIAPLMVNVLEIVGKARVTQVERALALAALEAALSSDADGTLPASMELPRSAYSGGELLYSREPSGRAELAAPADRALYDELHAHPAVRAPVLRFPLPPPGAPAEAPVTP